jgi:stage II sporulation protein D
LATTGASRRHPWRSTIALFVGVAASCTTGPVAPRPGLPSPGSGEVELRIGLVVGAGSASLGGGGSLVVSEPDGARIDTIPAGRSWQLTATKSGLALTSPGVASSPSYDALTVVPLDGRGAVRVNGRSYRGVAEIIQDRTGITVVNRVGMESYLLGVISAEMGRRSSNELAALQAQAVVSRTYALRNLRRRQDQGFDLYATVSDQVYGGVVKETSEAREAIATTRGQVITYRGTPIEALYHSTCGGRTAESFEVFRAASQPYLRSIADQAPNGNVYCSISPRYRWREEWTGESLRATLRRNLPLETGIAPERVREITQVKVTKRTPSGRVDQLTIGVGGSKVRVEGTAIRRVLRPADGQLLRSSAFALAATGAGSRVTHLTAEGMGAGHGVGFCQWGAVGRARAGQSYQKILAAYYPGTTVERRYR